PGTSGQGRCRPRLGAGPESARASGANGRERRAIMIRINRGGEPAALATARASELPRVQAIAATRPPTQDDIGGRYKIAHDALWNAQHYKCCYCESREQSKRNDVEHFRPKSQA